MNNRNQNHRTPTSAPTQLSALPSASPTYLNVFTVEEYESNAKTGKRWTTIGAAFPTKKASASASSSRPFS
jgi:hypothetical protein